MTRICITAFLVSSIFLSGLSQTKQIIDSLHDQLAMARNETTRIEALVQLCLFHRLGNTDSAMLYGGEALKEAETANYVRGQIEALGFMCIVKEQQGNLARSLELGFRALQLARENKMEKYAGGALDGIGEVYIDLKDFGQAMPYLQENAMVDFDSIGLGYGYFDMGNAFTGLGQLDSANFYEHKALGVFRDFHNEEPKVFQTLGDIQLKSGRRPEALDYYRESLEISLRKNEGRAQAYAYNRIAKLYMETGQSDSAIAYAEKGLQVSRMITQKETIQEAAALLAELYEPKDTRESIRYLKMADEYKDSVFGAGNIEAVQSIVVQEQRRQAEIEAAKAAYQTRLKQYALAGGVAVLVIVAIFLYRNNQKERKARLLLRGKNELIEKTLDDLKSTQAQLIQQEKMASLGELTAGIAHEIQNPLNFVNNFSEINGEFAAEAETARQKNDLAELKNILEGIKANQEKITFHGKRADSIVRGMLQHSQKSAGQKEPTDINALSDEYLRLAYHGLRAKDKNFNADIKTDFDDNIGIINVVSQDIGRVLLNLYNNAFYAVNEKLRTGVPGYKPVIEVRTRKSEGKIIITVSDNGNGIENNTDEKIFQPFFTTKPSGQGTGLGLSLSYDIVKAHGGEINVRSKKGEGALFTIQLPTGKL